VNAESVKTKLKNLAEITGKTFQEELIYYGLERTIYRLSISEYADRFVLKGGIFLYALFNGEFVRATSDIDLLAERISNDTKAIRQTFREIFSIEADDALTFDLSTLDVHKITELKEYHGVNVSIMGFLDRTRVPVSIDIGFGDVIFPSKVNMEFPVLLNMDAPKIFAYSVSSVIAEKLEAIVSLGFLNSRYKDFYDIYILAGQYEIREVTLAESITETFKKRGTGFENIIAFTDEFFDDQIHKKRWEAFIKKKRAMVQVELSDTIERIRKLAIPVIEDIRKEKIRERLWVPEKEEWEEK
jgi:predicted nucleotidyltransferase component of viral defense system